MKYKTILPKYCQLDPAMKTMAQIRAFIKQKSNEIFFTKHMSWKGENEFRIVCNTSDYLDISEAISAVYLTSCDSLECELTEKLVADIIPVKYLRYTGTSKNLALPILCETKKSRLQNIKAKNNPDNALNTIQQQAREIYESKKNILRASLLQEVIHLKNKD